MPHFTKKLTGASAELFAAVCLEYSRSAEESCCDTPPATPLFNWLSPYQRVQLVSQLATGLLCRDEPLPPSTIQHYTAYRALVQFLKEGLLAVEIDMQNDHDPDDIGADLVVEDWDNDDQVYLSKQEKEERSRNWELVKLRAEKNKKKLNRGKKVPQKDAKEEEEQEVAQLSKEEAVKKQILGSLERVTKYIEESNNILFHGPPISAQERAQIRQPTKGTEEEGVFIWRQLVEKACLEDTTGFLPKPLSQITFDWRSQNTDKWNMAIDALFITLSSVYFSEKENALAVGGIGDAQYADPSQHARILQVDRNANILRATYDPFWKPETLSQDQRLIFAISSTRNLGCQANVPWRRTFFTTCVHKGIDFRKPGKFQERLDIYKSLQSECTEGLDKSFCYGLPSFDSCETPAAYVPLDKESFARCSGPGCWGHDETKLMKCSKCKVVWYCSAACQKKHWPEHKKQCKDMAKLRKNKEAIAQMAKAF